MFDWATNQTVAMKDITDGTSNTILAGESVPWLCANISFFGFGGGHAGCTIPVNWNSNSMNGAAGCIATSTGLLGCRYTQNNRGWHSMHPGGCNFVFADGSVHFIKNSIQVPTLCALGSHQGGELVNADAY